MCAEIDGIADLDTDICVGALCYGKCTVGNTPAWCEIFEFVYLSACLKTETSDREKLAFSLIIEAVKTPDF